MTTSWTCTSSCWPEPIFRAGSPRRHPASARVAGEGRGLGRHPHFGVTCLVGGHVLEKADGGIDMVTHAELYPSCIHGRPAEPGYPSLLSAPGRRVRAGALPPRRCRATTFGPAR